MSLSENQKRYLYLAIAIIVIGSIFYTKFFVVKDNIDYGDVSVSEAKTLIDKKTSLIILDVRTLQEYEEGHIDEAINIPVQELEKRLNELSKDEEMLIYCRTGNRSGQAVKILESNGYNKIFHMNEGITRWIAEGHQLVQ
jgi:rhodanese-related sulfurtransferase